MLTEGLGKHHETPTKHFPPRSMSTPFHYQPHPTRSNENKPIINQSNEISKKDTYLEKFSPEELALICELQEDEQSEFDQTLQKLVEKQQEINNEAKETIHKFSAALKLSKDFVPNLSQASNNYQKAAEIRSSLDVIAQFRNLDINSMTPMNQELF